MTAALYAYRDSITKNFIAGNVRHLDKDGNETLLPEVTESALFDIGRTSSGNAFMRKALETNQTVTLRHIMDDGHTFWVWPDNLIFYTTDIEQYINLNLPYSLPGRQLGSSTLGSLLSHEFGHTEIGGSLNELESTSLFENDYRKAHGLPRVDSYYTPGDVCQFEGRMGC